MIRGCQSERIRKQMLRARRPQIHLRDPVQCFLRRIRSIARKPDELPKCVSDFGIEKSGYMQLPLNLDGLPAQGRRFRWQALLAVPVFPDQ